MWRRLLFVTLPIVVILVALLSSSPFFILTSGSLPLPQRMQQQLKSALSRLQRRFPQRSSTALQQTRPPTMATTTKTPVYFFSHGGPDVQYRTEHPVYPVLQAIGREITQKVKPKAAVVFSAHWQALPNEIHFNNAVETDLIYDFYGFPPEFYEAKYPSRGDPALAARVQSLLTDAGIPSQGLKRGLDHGVFSGFNVAFNPESNPLGVPLVLVSLFNSEDPDAHYRLGQAVSALRDEVVIICTGMTVHNLRDRRFTLGDPKPLPYSVSFDEALKEAVEAPPGERQERMREVAKRPDAKQAHPWMDHLMPLYVAAGAAGEDRGKRTWTLHEASFAWGQYRFGEVPS